MPTFTLTVTLVHPPAPVVRQLTVPEYYPTELLADAVQIVLGWEGLRELTFLREDGEVLPDEGPVIELLRAAGGPELRARLDNERAYEAKLVLTEATDDFSEYPVLVAAEGISPPEEPEPDEELPTEIPVVEINRELVLLTEELEDEVASFVETVRGEADDSEEQLNLDWLAEEYGILLGDDVYDLPPRIMEIEEEVMAIDPADPAAADLLAELQALVDAHPELPVLRLLLAGFYVKQDQPLRGRAVQDSLKSVGVTDNLWYTLVLLHAQPPEMLVPILDQLPHPPDVRSFPAGRGGRYNVEEFLEFEEFVIRYYLMKRKYHAALFRLDRLVRIGFHESNLEDSAGLLVLFQRDFPAEAADSPQPLDGRTEALLAVMETVLGAG